MELKENHEYRWHHVSEKLPAICEQVWFLWKDNPDDVVIGYRSYEGDSPTEGWYELENKARWTHWWHPIRRPIVTQEMRDKILSSKIAPSQEKE
jgi:hypothetical protein